MLIWYDNGPKPEEEDISFDEGEVLGEWPTNDTSNEFRNSFQGNFIDLCEYLNILEDRLENQKVLIQFVKLKLEEEIVLEENNEEETTRHE